MIRSASSRVSSWIGHCAFALCALLCWGSLAAQTFTASITGPTAAVGPGSVQNYVLTFNNTGMVPLPDLDLNLSLAPGLVLLNPASIGCAASTGVQVCSIASLPLPMASVTLPFQLQMPASIGTPPQQSFAIVYSADSSLPASASGGSLTATVSLARTLNIIGTASPSPVASGNSFSYTLDQTLSGANIDWTALSITLNAAPQVQLGSASGAGYSCTGSSSQQVCTSTIPALGVATRSLTVAATAGVVSTNTPVTATVTATGPFLNGGTATVPQTITGAPLDLALSLNLDSSSPAPPGSSARFVLAVRNLSVLGGPGASGIQAQLHLPPGLSFSSASGVAWNCSGSGPVLCSYLGSVSPQQDSNPLQINTTSAATVSGALAVNASLVAPLDASSTNNDASATVVFNAPRLTLQKTGPATAAVGELLEYTLTVGNTGNASASNVIVVDELPLQLGAPTAAGEGCVVSAGVVRCVLASVPAGSQQTVTIQAAALSAGNIVNRATASVVGASVQAAASTTVSAQADLAVLMTGPASVPAGAALDYSIVVRNSGSAAASDVQLSDALPGALELVAVEAPGWNCTPGAPLRCALQGELAAAASAPTVLLRTRVVSSTQAGILRNTVEVSASNDRNLANNRATVETTIPGQAQASADLRLQLAPGGSYAATGNVELEFSGSLQNQGPDLASTLRISGSVQPASAQVQSVRIGTLDCPSLANCVLGSLASGASVPVTVRVRIDAATVPSLSLRLDVLADTRDPQPADNTASSTATRSEVVPQSCCDLQLRASGPTRIELGSDATVEFSVRNLGAEAVSGLALNGSLANLVFQSASGFSCSSTGTALSCTGGTLAAGASTTARLVLRANAAGEARVSLRATSASPDPQPGNNLVDVLLSVDPADTGTTTTLLEALDDPVVQASAAAVADICDTPSAALQAQCSALIGAAASGNRDAAIQAARALLPDELLGQGGSMDQLAQVQFDNVDVRMEELRSGSEGFSANGLSFSDGRQALSLGLFSALLDDEADEEPEIGESGDLISRWGGFVNGAVTRGEQSSGSALDGTRDFDVLGITAGVDYRKSARWVLGAALGYNRFDSALPDDGTLDTRAWTLSAYTSFYPRERLYVDGRISYGRSQVETSRRILIPGVVDLTAQGETDVGQQSLALAMGYQWYRGSWNLTPNANIRYVRSRFAAFSETGAGDNSAQFAGQSTRSTQLSLGMQLSRAISLSRGVLAPQFDVALTHEFNDEGFAIDASLVGAPDVRIQARGPEPDRGFGNVGLGLVFVAGNGRQAFVSYRRLFGAEGVERATINLGARFEF